MKHKSQTVERRMVELEGMLPPATGSKDNNEYWWTIDPQSLVLVRVGTVRLIQLAEHDCAYMYTVVQ